ncbi:hypothetical protein COO60DRAFT_1565287 [Scenedesmus sp. NREL 46B-D3]|nr:hypothetical protein COO60DRAFT_1565287 [Scenedesmus sp. NREL 46B-D3]
MRWVTPCNYVSTGCRSHLAACSSATWASCAVGHAQRSGACMRIGGGPWGLCVLLKSSAVHACCCCRWPCTWPTPWTGKSLEQAGKVLHASGWAVHFWCERRTWHYVCAVACMWPAPAALADLQLACSLPCECICRREHLGADAQAVGACCCKLCRLARGDRQLLRYGCQTPPAVTRTCPSVNVLPLVYTNCNKTT